MIGQEDMVITGISGGADSVCLLYVLRKLQAEEGFGLAAVHVNHGLRGADADADERYVRELCEKWGIPLLTVRRDVASYAGEHGLSCEEAGREVRRAAYEAAAEKFGGTRIALAHHMEDHAETVLLNLARGTGLKGLAGIRPVSGVYIRPLLAVRRAQIERYLAEQGIGYCTDQTNFQELYARNRIRRRVLPYLEQEINARTPEHILELSRQMEELSGYLERQTDRVWARCVTEEKERYFLDIGELQRADPVLVPYLIRRALAQAAGREKDIGQAHVRAVSGLMSGQSGRSADLPYGLRAVRQYGRICIGKRDALAETPGEPEKEMVLCEPGEPDGERTYPEGIRIRIFPCGKIPGTFPELPYTKWFDYDIIKCTVVLRHRRPGDYLDIDGLGHRQKLKKYFINEKVPAEKRSQVLLAAEGSQILWAVGYRQNQRYQVTRETRRILEISLAGCGGEKDG